MVTLRLEYAGKYQMYVFLIEKMVGLTLLRGN